MITVCSVLTTPCSNSLQDVFGASIDLSATINPTIQNPFISVFNLPVLNQDSEANVSPNGGGMYYNRVSGQSRCFGLGVWANCNTGGGGGGTPGGGNTQLQFNDNGAFGGTTGLLWNKITNVLTVPGGTTLSSSTANETDVEYNSLGVYTIFNVPETNGDGGFLTLRGVDNVTGSPPGAFVLLTAIDNTLSRGGEVTLQEGSATLSGHTFTHGGAFLTNIQFTHGYYVDSDTGNQFADNLTMLGPFDGSGITNANGFKVQVKAGYTSTANGAIGYDSTANKYHGAVSGVDKVFCTTNNETGCQITPGGSPTQLQYNNGGLFDGTATLTWNNSTNTLTLPGATQVTNSGVVANATDLVIGSANMLTLGQTTFGPGLVLEGSDTGSGTGCSVGDTSSHRCANANLGAIDNSNSFGGFLLISATSGSTWMNRAFTNGFNGLFNVSLNHGFVLDGSTGMAYTDGITMLDNTAQGLFDASGLQKANAFKLPVKAGLTATSNGSAGYDSTANKWHGAINNADQVFCTTARESGCGTLLFASGPQSAIVGTGADAAIYSFTVPGNTLTANGCLKFAVGYQHTTGSTNTTYKIKYGGTPLTIMTSTAASQATAGGIVCTTGATNTEVMATYTAYMNGVIAPVNTTAAIDSTTNQTFEVDFNVANTDAVTPKFIAVELERQ